MVDYPDRPFTITQPAGSTIFGTPSAAAHSVPREQVPQFYGDFFNTPSALNNYQTINRYWMENSYGKYGVELVPVRPVPAAAEVVPVPHRQLPERRGGLPELANCPRRRRRATAVRNQNYFTAVRDGLERATCPPTCARRSTTRYYVSAGQDESATWQEFGEMRFTGPEAVSDAFGPKHIDPLHARGNWATTRYIPWTSWAAASNIWPSRQRHGLDRGRELRHGRVRARALAQPRPAGQLQQPVRRAAAAHGRRHVGHDEPRLVQRPGRPAHPLADPADAGRRARRAARHPQQAEARLRRRPTTCCTLNRDGLAQTGTIVAEVKAREVAPGDDLAGVRVVLDGAGDTNPPCRWQTRPDVRGPVVLRRRPATAVGPRLQRLHGRGRPADRLGLVHRRQRRADRQEQERRTRPAARSTARPGTSTPTRRTSTRSTTSRPTARPSRRRSATSARPTTARSTRARTRARSTSSRPPATSCSSTSSTSAPTPRASTATRSASARSPAPARRRVASSSATPVKGTAEGLADLHVRAQEHGRGGRPAGRTRTRRRTSRSTSTATSTACRRRRPARAGRRTSRTRSPRRSSARRSQVPVYIDKVAGAAADRLGHPDRDVGERPVQDACPSTARSAPATPWAAPSRRRSL